MAPSEVLARISANQAPSVFPLTPEPDCSSSTASPQDSTEPQTTTAQDNTEPDTTSTEDEPDTTSNEGDPDTTNNEGDPDASDTSTTDSLTSNLKGNSTISPKVLSSAGKCANSAGVMLLIYVIFDI